MAIAIVTAEPETVTLTEVELPPLDPGTVRLRTRCTLLSAGTESTVLHRRFAAGTHWDRMFDYPARLGYCCVAEVAEVGPDVSRFTVGDRVVVQAGHASEHVVHADRCTRVPEAVSDEDAVWFALAKVAYVAADVSGAGLGTRVLVVGAGPVGQMAIRWLVAQGAYVVVAERRSTIRTDLARAGGAVETRRTDSIGSDEPFDVVVDCTGDPAAFAVALRTAADHGRVVLLGDVGNPAEQCLTSDLIIRGLTVVGAHGNHLRGEREYRVRELFFRLVSTGRIPVAGLVTHRFAPEQCAEAYAVVENDRARCLGVVFDWQS